MRVSSHNNDSFDLSRFVTAQDDLYAKVLLELKAGEKRTHWMWFIVPQVAGLGHSDLAAYYAVHSHDEAEAYFAHPVLGARLCECTSTVLTLSKSAHQVFGSPDDLKFRSSMTLFEKISGNGLFTAVLWRATRSRDLADPRFMGELQGLIKRRSKPAPKQLFTLQFIEVGGGPSSARLMTRFGTSISTGTCPFIKVRDSLALCRIHPRC